MADIAFDAKRHARLHDAVIALIVDVLAMNDIGIFAGHADTMGQCKVTPRLVGLRNLPRLLGVLLECHAWSDQRHVGAHLVEGHAIELTLRGGRFTIAAQKRPREIGVIAITADHIGIQGDQFPRLHRPIGTLLKPRVGAWARVHQPRFDVVGVGSDDVLVQVRPDLILRRTGADRRFQLAHALLHCPQRTAHHLDLVGHLDRSCPFQRHLGIADLPAPLDQREGSMGGRALNGDLIALLPAALAHQCVDLVGPCLGGLLKLVITEIVGDRCRRTCLINAGQPFGKVGAARELEHHYRAFRGNKGVAGRVTCGVDLHVSRTGGIAHVGRVEQHGGDDIVLF